MPTKPDPRELLDRLLEDAVEEMEGTRNITSGAPMAFDYHRVRFTQEQEDLLQEAMRRRGVGTGVGNKGPSYIALATIAFIAWDLGMDFFEVLSGRPLPQDPAAASFVMSLSRNARGQWGIRDVADRTGDR